MVLDLARYASVTQTDRNLLTTSPAYQFVPTTRALDVLADHGWQPVQVREAGTKKPEFRGYQKHVVSLENPQLGKSLDVGDVVPRIVLTNSHKGDAAFHLYAGLL